MMIIFTLLSLIYKYPNYRTKFFKTPTPPNLEYQDSFDFLYETENYKCIIKEHQTPVTKEDPTNYLKRILSGKCFEMTHTFFWYFKFCPFQNLTQYRYDEKKSDLKIDNFVLGKYHGDSLVKNKRGFSDQFNGGDNCNANSKPRTAKIEYICDMSIDGIGKLASVSEPSFCNYDVHFHTPHACGFKNITSEDLYTIDCYITH